MNIKIIKGTNQIGGCITEISTKNTNIIIDFGSNLDNETIPFDLKGLTSGNSIYQAVFITHYHKDHIGLINQINKDIPIYIEENTLKIYQITCDFCSEEQLTRNVNTFKLGKQNLKIIIGDLEITPYRIDHSAYNSCMYLIKGEGKTLLHTGDFRLHGRKRLETIKNLRQIGEIDLLITEGTTLSRKDSKFNSEEDLEQRFIEYMQKYDQVFMLQSSTNIDRTVSFIKAALKSNKNVLLDPFTYAINKVINLNIDIDFKKVFVWKPIKYQNKDLVFKMKYMNFTPNASFGKKYAMQIKSSYLKDIIKLSSKDLITNACLIYSMWDGYLEKDKKLKEFISNLEKRKIECIKLHTSGHADIESLKLLNKIVNPTSIIVIHTNNPAKALNIFNNVRTLKDGEIFALK